MVGNFDELQDEYKTELLEFLIQKINHAGGSLQFQHLSGLLQQLRFKVKDTFGVTKPALMKFLKSNANTFKINSKGVVTVVNSTLDNNNYPAEEDNKTDIAKKISVSKIENGKGKILKIFPRYAIIKTTKPIDTYIFFTPLEYGADKNTLFVDLALSVNDKVCFNAIHGHIDYEIEYRATKVWRISDEDSPPENTQKDKITKPKKFNGEGVIKQLLSNVGFIAISGKDNECIFFYKSNFKQLNIRCGDQVQFVAEYISNEWQATEMTKKKSSNRPPDHHQACINKSSNRSQTFIKQTDKHVYEDESIRNEPGRIFPHSKGVIIKFGKKFSELADCSECNFYLYNIKVAYQEIAMEFSEGEDVKFDAVKSKGDAPVWKAVLVWVGEKPAVIPNKDKKFKENFDNTKSLNKVDNYEFSSDHSSERVRKIKSNKDINIADRERELNIKKTRFDRPPTQNFNCTSENYHKDNVVASKMMSQKFPHKNSKSRSDKSIKKHNKKFNDKYNQKTSFSKPKFDKVEKNSENLLISRDSDLDVSDYSEVASEENNELQDSSYFTRKFLKEDKQYLTDTSDRKDESCSESETENEKAFAKGKSSIKNFEAIDGKIVHLYCKFGFIKSDHLTKDVDFILNAFYINGKAVEEQEITDLKEIIEVGDIIKFNGFEIVDDDGEIHQKVTIAWKGPKPSVRETKPEEFIAEYNLNVSCLSEPSYESKLVGRFHTSTNITFDEAPELDPETESSLNDKCDDMSQEHLVASSKSRLDEVDEHKSPDVVHHEKLPDMVLRKLRTHGFVSSSTKDALNVAQEVIDLVLNNCNLDDQPVKQNCSLKSDSANLCSSCRKTKKPLIEGVTMDAEVQTIFTGEVVATSIFTEDY